MLQYANHTAQADIVADRSGNGDGLRVVWTLARSAAAL